ncbi:MAG: hypothetical protein ACI92O_001368 [Colwellia sp.]|jgi:hypothetical protein
MKLNLMPSMAIAAEHRVLVFKKEGEYQINTKHSFPKVMMIY